MVICPGADEDLHRDVPGGKLRKTGADFLLGKGLGKIILFLPDKLFGHIAVEVFQTAQGDLFQHGPDIFRSMGEISELSHAYSPIIAL